jgi:hypothetical protein
VRFVTVGSERIAKIPSMRNRISFLQRVMDEVKRQPPVAPVEAGQDVETDEGPFPESSVTPLRPLQVFVEVDALRTLVADALEALRWSETRICTTPERTAAWDRAVEQRRRFLSWLGTRGHQKLFLAMYPEYLLAADADAETGPDEQLT